MLVKEFRLEGIKKGFILKIYLYGNLKIIVRYNMIIKVRNIKGDLEFWNFFKKRYIELNKLFGIRDCKFSSKFNYRNNKNKNKINKWKRLIIYMVENKMVLCEVDNIVIIEGILVEVWYIEWKNGNGLNIELDIEVVLNEVYIVKGFLKYKKVDGIDNVIVKGY